VSEVIETTATTFNNINTTKVRVLKLNASKEAAPVTAVDVSSINLGETKSGVLIAVRGAVVHKHDSKYHYVKLGPFPFHVTEQNKQEVFQTFGRDLRETSFAQELTTAPDATRLQTSMARTLERWLQTTLCLNLHDNIILWDGSLTAGAPDTPTRLLKRLLDVAKKNRNIVLAFSKFTRLRLWGRQFKDLLEKHQPPCVFPIDVTPTRKTSITQLGKIYIAKLGSQTFRLDVDKEIPLEQAVEAIEKLIGNDLVVNGYPETLRLAHILCTFTASEVIGIQRYLAQKCYLKIFAKPNVRRVLFGPFGKGQGS